MSVIDEIAAERRRQVLSEGWTVAHDDQHTDESLALAAACYAIPNGHRRMRPEATGSYSESRCAAPVKDVPVQWPSSWHPCWWNPKDRRRDLIRAAALLVAEIERLDRAGEASQ